MSLANFLIELQESGKVIVLGTETPSACDLSDAENVLNDIDSSARLHFPGEAPELKMPTALWAAIRLYRGCQFLVYREIPIEVIKHDLSDHLAGNVDPASIYSVDLTFNCLPDLFRLANGLSSDDPLVECIRSLGQDWPLSSVGMKDIENVDITPILTHEGLTQLYVDRIVTRKDWGRADSPGVAERIQRDVGLFTDLLPSSLRNREEELLSS